MSHIYKHIKMVMVTVITVTMFFSCKNNFKDIQNIGVLGDQPVNIAEDINTKYTDSGRLKSHLISPKMLDFSNRKFAFTEFPDGIDLTVYDEQGNKNTVTADYAISYDETKLIDLRGNVILATHKNDTLFAEQLFYDQKREWMFTNQPVTFLLEDKIINGDGFDSDRTFEDVQVFKVYGKGTIDE